MADTAPLEAAQILAKARWLENNPEHQQMRDKMKERWRLHSMLDEPMLTPSLTRGQSIIVNSPRILSTGQTLMADILSYTTSTRAVAHVPHGENRQALENKAADLSKALVIGKDQLNDGSRVDRDSIRHQLISAYCVWILHCKDAYDDDGNPTWCWWLEVPSPDTCFFPVTGGPVRPKYFARRYRELITELEAKYSGQRNGEHAGKRLKRNGKAWDFEAVSDDHSADGDNSNGTSGDDPEHEILDCEVVEYMDSDWLYHVVVNGNGYTNTKADTGTVVYAERNRVKGGPPVVVFSGATGVIRGERLTPFLWPVYQIVKYLNLAESIIATITYNLKPDVLIQNDPETYRAMMEAGFVRAATTLEMEEGGPNLVDIGGKPHWWQIPPQEQFDAQIVRKYKELDDYLAQIQSITSYEVIEKSTANLGLLAAGNVETQQGPMLKDRAYAWREALDMWLDTIDDYGETFDLFAKPGQRHAHGAFKEGEGLSIGPDALKGWSWEIEVDIKNSTAAMRRAQLEDWARRNQLRVSPLDEAWEIAGYPSKQEWVEAMAEDEVIRLSATAHAGFVQAAGDADLLTSGGIDAQALQQFWAPPIQPPVEGGGATNQPMRAPETAGVNGGSSPGGTQ